MTPRGLLRHRLPAAVVTFCLIALAGLGLAAGQSRGARPGGAPPPGRGAVNVSGFVRVIEGDTFETWIDGQRTGIGILGLEVPQANTACGRDAAAQLSALTKGGLLLEEDPDPALAFDARKRRMFHATTPDGRLVAEEQIRSGHARALGKGKHRDRLAAAEAQARAAGKGCALQPGAAPGGAAGAAPVAPPPAASARPAGAAPPAPAFGAARLGELLRPPAAEAAPLQRAVLPAGYVEEVVAGGLALPTAFAPLPDGRILFAQQNGVVHIQKDGAVLPGPFVDLRDRVNAYWDRGLIGLAADPDFAANGFVYLLYSYEDDPLRYNGTKTARLTRVTARGDAAAPGSEVVLLGTATGVTCQALPKGADCLPSDGPSHSVGDLAFAPDGTLFVSVGDSASFNLVDDLALRAQDVDSLAGKVLRVTRDGRGVPGNPFWNGDSAAARSKVWAYGLRNPYRFTLRPGTDVPYVGDVGWGVWEEIDVATPGGNFGWPCYEGAAPQDGYAAKAACQALFGQGPDAVRLPLLTWDHGPGSAAVTGGVFVTGTSYPAALQGAYVYGDYGQGVIRSLRVDAAQALVPGSTAGFATGAGGPVKFAVGPAGDLLYLDIVAGELRRIRYLGTDVPPPVCPAGQYLAEYFTDRALSGTPLVTRCEAAIDHTWGAAAPAPGVGADDFSVRWTGRHAFASGRYTVTATADDGIRLWLDGSLLIDAWRDQSGTEHRAVADVTAGEHEVRVEYYEHGYDAVARVGWAPVAGSSPPQPGISAPTAAQRWRVGDVITYAGAATDPEDGPLPADALSWQVLLHHCPGGQCHLHPFASGTGAGGSFVAPDHGDESFLEIVLSARDSAGLTASAAVTLQPRTVRLAVDTEPPGLRVVLAGSGEPAPVVRDVVAGSSHSIYAPSPQGERGDLAFAGWSDGGAQQHDVATGDADVKITARFVAPTTPPAGGASPTPSPSGPPPATPPAPALSAAYGAVPPALWRPGESKTYAVVVTNSGSQAWNATGANRVRLGVHFGDPGAGDAPHDGWATDQRVELPADVPPGGSRSVTVTVTAPGAAGAYTLRHRMVKEEVAWFAQIQKSSVAVGSGAASPTVTAGPPATANPSTATRTPAASATRTPSASPTALPNPPSPTPVAPSAVHVGDLDASAKATGRDWRAEVRVAVHGADEQPVAGAVVSGAWSGGASGRESCTTDGAGRCTVTSPKLSGAAASVAFAVDGVAAGRPYAREQNHDPDGESGGSAITVRRP